jgi:hypothetical protein
MRQDMLQGRIPAYFVFESWTTLPLWIALMRTLCGSLIAECETRTGPMGADESIPLLLLPRIHTFRERPLAIPELFRARADIVTAGIT